MENRFHCIFSPGLLKLLSECQKPFQAQSFALCIFIFLKFYLLFQLPPVKFIPDLSPLATVV